MSVIGRREERPEPRGLVSVIEDEEPPGFGLQPLLEGVDGRVQVVFGMRKTKLAGEFGRASLQTQGRLRIDQATALSSSLIRRRTHGGLGLADAAQAPDGLAGRPCSLVRRFRRSAMTSSRPAKNAFRR